MKFRNKISTVFSIALLLSLGAVAFISQAKALSDEEAITDKEGTQELSFLTNPSLVELGLDDPSFLDNNGSIAIPEDGTLLDICLPESLGKETLNAIAPNAFSGTSCLRSITLPASIREIGQNAFADCPHLEYIVLQDRFDLEGLTLGENWNGNATVIFGLVQATSSAESTADIDATLSEDTEDLNSEDTVTEYIHKCADKNVK